MLIFSSLITISKADTYIDVENYNDDRWHWGVDEGNHIMFEIEFAISDPGTGNLVQQFKDLMIFNISSIENITKIIGSLPLQVSQVNSTRLYYNSSLATLEEIEDDPQVLAEFALNNSHPAEYHYMSEMNAVPLLLPLNSTDSIEWANITKILNDTMYTDMAKGNFSRFDLYGFNKAADSLWFKNSTDGYYINASYYSVNGTIKNAEGSILAPFGDSDGPMMLNFTAVRVFNYNITEDVVWGIGVGDTFIYDFTETNHDEVINDDNGFKDLIAGEVKVEITKINETTFWLHGNGFGDENDTSPMVYQGVYADIYFWNFTLNTFVLEMGNYLIGAANNFYPTLISEKRQFVIPISATQEDFEYMFNPDILEDKDMPFDESNIVWGTIILFEMWNSTGNETVKVRINSTNGVFMNYLMVSDRDFMYFELKNMTYIDWGVDIGESFYFKEFGGDGEREIKVTIIGFGYFFENLSFYFDNFLGAPLPAGQPELQFFSVVMGIVDHWDPITETWIHEYDPYGPVGGPLSGPMFRPIAAANEYWAIAPPMLSEGPPILLPNGTTGFDPEFQNLFNFMSFMFDDISYGIDWVVLKNTTENKNMQYNFSVATGMTTFIGGWMYNYDDYWGTYSWDYFSDYLETSVDLVTGLNTIPLQSLFVLDLSITAEISVSGPGAKFIYALNSINPVDEAIPLGDILGYLDLKITNHSLMTENITLTINFPGYVDLNTYYPYFWAWNMGGMDKWDGAPQEFYDSVIYNYVANSVEFEIPMSGPVMILVGMSYGTEPPLTAPGDFTLTSNAGDPDEDGNFILSWTASEGADSYSVFVTTTGCISNLSLLAIPIAFNITDLTYSITNLPNGTYYFVVVAHNLVGETLSNCLTIIVGSGVFDEIPGYDLLIVLISFISVSAIIIKKRRK
jgi:hypothetical protein